MSVAMDWDEGKRQRNIRLHGVDFTAAAGFDRGAALTREDTRNDYGERRFVSIGPIGSRLQVMVWTMRGARRIISLRKANGREERLYHGS